MDYPDDKVFPETLDLMEYQAKEVIQVIEGTIVDFVLLDSPDSKEIMENQEEEVIQEYKATEDYLDHGEIKDQEDLMACKDTMVHKVKVSKFHVLEKFWTSILGQAGQPGIPGQQGGNGPKGLIIYSGVEQKPQTGDQGDVGYPGNVGLDGEPGLTGEAGRDGEKGEAGYPGLEGLVGPGGKNGSDGRDGFDGAPGEDAYLNEYTKRQYIGDRGRDGFR